MEKFKTSYLSPQSNGRVLKHTQELEYARVQQRQCLSDKSAKLTEIIETAQTNAAKSMFSNLSKKKQLAAKLQMNNKLNRLKHQQTQKEQRLNELYVELDRLTKLNLNDEMACISAEETMLDKAKQKQPHLDVFNGRADDVLVTLNATSKPFDFTNLASIIERKQLIESKLQTTNQKLKEEAKMTEVYKEMI